MGENYSSRYFVALPGGLAVVIFVWWLVRELRKSGASRQAQTHGPIHIVVINQDTSNVDHSSRVGGTEHVVEEAAYDKRWSARVDGDAYHAKETPRASTADGDGSTEAAQGTNDQR